MHSLKHIQVYLFLHGKNVSKDAVDKFLSILHADIKSGRITKAKDSYHKEVDRIQRSLVGMSNAMWPGEVVKVEIEAPRKKHYESCLSYQGLKGFMPVMISGAAGKVTEYFILKLFSNNGLGGIKQDEKSLKKYLKKKGEKLPHGYKIAKRKKGKKKAVKNRKPKTVKPVKKVAAKKVVKKENGLQQFIDVINKSKNFESAFKTVSAIKGVPKETSKMFAEKYNSEGKLSPKDAFRKFYNEVKGIKEVDPKIKFDKDIVNIHNEIMKAGVTRSQAENILAYMGSIETIKSTPEKRLRIELVRIPGILDKTATKIIKYFSTEKTKKVSSQKTKAPKSKVKASITAAISDLLTLDKYKKYGAMFLGMFYSTFKNSNTVEKLEGIKYTMFKKYEYDLFEGDEKWSSAKGDWFENVELTDKGKELIKSIDGRLNTLKAKKSGTDLFPELSGTKGFKVSKKYWESLKPFEQEYIKQRIDRDGLQYLKTLISAARKQYPNYVNLSPVGVITLHDGKELKFSGTDTKKFHALSGTKKIRKVMREFKAGKLHSGSKKGPIVKKVKQAKAIALSEQRKSENLGTISATVDEVLANMRSERKGIKHTSKQNTHVLPAAQKVEKFVLETPANTVTETSTNTVEKVGSIQPVNSLGAISAAEMGKMTFTKIKFNDYYKGIFGEPATNFDMCIDGSPGAGKTTFLLKFANHLADFHGPTLFVTTEEFGSATLIDKIQKFDITSKNLAFAKKVPSFDELKKYKYVFIDSINHARITIEQYQQMREAAPNTAFILVLQQTKSGTYKGGTDWPHEVEITMSLRKNEFGERYLNITKDRYTEPVPRQVTI